MKGFDFYIRSKQDLTEAVKEFGIVPLFRNSIPGFSVEEHTAPELWFTDREGVWEWKGPVIRDSGCAYGKFFEKKAVFVSIELFPDLANYRRDGYDFDARFDDGLASYADKHLYELLAEQSPVCSKDLRRMASFGQEGAKIFDAAMNRLQGQGYAVISDFVYALDRFGRPYGWGLAEYATPEQHFGSDFTDRVYQRKPEESFLFLLEHLKKLFPTEREDKLRRYLRRV